VDTYDDLKTPWHRQVLAGLRLLPLLWRTSAWLTALDLVLLFVMSAMPTLLLYATGRFILLAPAVVKHGFNSPDGTVLEQDLVLLAVAVGLSQVLSPLQWATSWAYQRRFGNYLQRLLVIASTQLPGLANLEDQLFQRKLEVA
jgi:hypothetical protein